MQQNRIDLTWRAAIVPGARADSDSQWCAGSSLREPGWRCETSPRRLSSLYGLPHPRPVAFGQLVNIMVEDYDPATRFFVDALGFDLVEDDLAAP